MKLIRKNKPGSNPVVLADENQDIAKTNEGGKSESEIAAVISLAMNMYVQQMMEYEDAIITIQKVIKPYSPWSSKIYGLRQTPLHIPGIRTRLK